MSVRELSIRTTDCFSDTYWRNGLGQLHRLDGPAVEYKDGEQRWYRYGVLHREDGPAIEYRDGSSYWFLDGQRITDPLVIFLMQGNNLEKESQDV